MVFDWNDFDLHTPELYTSRGYPWEAWDIQGLVHTHRQAGGSFALHQSTGECARQRRTHERPAVDWLSVPVRQLSKRARGIEFAIACESLAAVT